ncbi:MAG: Ig-like domain-containing protein, partial [Clostridia bacterium]|nr:Ig-like domain-containing protein [Clostridia bacterium]
MTAISAGTAVITATSEDGEKTATCTVTVVEKTQQTDPNNPENPPAPVNVAVESVSISPASAEITEGETRTVTANVLPSNATNKKVSWSSSNTAVATVNENGTITAVKAGTATITVTTEDGNKTSTCAVTVEANTVPPPQT